MKLTRPRIAAISSLALLDILFFTRINPVSSPSLVLFAGFIVVACNIFAISYVLLKLSKMLVAYPKGSVRRPSMLVAGLFVVILALQSVGQLTVRDVVAVMALSVLFWFYGSYFKRKQA